MILTQKGNIMLINLTTDFSYLLEREIVSFNRQDTFGSKPEIINYCSQQADKNEWSYIFLPYRHNNSYIDLTDFLTFHKDSIAEFLPVEDDKLLNLRVLFLAEETDSFYIVDITYDDAPEAEYHATQVTVYDEREYVPNYVYTFDIPNDLISKSPNIKFHMLERRLDVEFGISFNQPSE